MQMIIDPSVTHFELQPLDPSSYYIFQVIAYTAAGKGPPITRRGATLLEGGETSPHSLDEIGLRRRLFVCLYFLLRLSFQSPRQTSPSLLETHPLISPGCPENETGTTDSTLST